MTIQRTDGILATGALAPIDELETRVSELESKAVYPESFGAVGDGVTDDSEAIQDAINAIEDTGIVQLSAKTYACSSTLIVTNSNVVIRGAGGDTNHDVGSIFGNTATVLKWTGAVDGTLLKIYPTTGVSGQKTNGCVVEAISFDCSSASYGIDLQSHWGGAFTNLYFYNPKIAGIRTGIVTGGLGEAEDVHRNLFSNISSRNDSDAANGGLFLLDGDSTLGANTSYNTFINCHARVKDGCGFKLMNTDANRFIACKVTRGTGTGNAIEFHGGDASINDVSRHNHFYGFGSGNGIAIVAKGTDTYTYASYNNIVEIDLGNATSVPTVETGATCFYWTSDNLAYRLGMFQVGLGDNITNARSARDALDTETVRIRNNSSNHVILEKGDGTQTWAIDVDSATGNLRLRTVDGVGDIFLDAFGYVRFNTTKQASSDVAISGYLEVKDDAGNVVKLATIT